MQNTFQFENVSILDHGNSVWHYSKLILTKKWEKLKLPEWFKSNYTFIVNHTHSFDLFKLYNIYHDCGKPYCITQDEHGKHFFNHAEISAQTWKRIHSNQVVENLIRYDMHLHTCKATELFNSSLELRDYFTLLVTAFAELHANADMFGGVDSTSFKIKWKRLNQRGKQLMKNYLPDLTKRYSYVIVRKDLDKRQKAVQGSHAAIEMSKMHTKEVNDHPSVIFVEVKSESKLKEIMARLLEHNIEFSVFTEPSLNDEITALCTVPLNQTQREPLRHFKLVDFQ